MRSQFAIKKDRPCEISIVGISDDYIDDDVIKRSYRSFKYDECVTVNKIYAANSKEEYELVDTLVHYHDNYVDRVRFKIPHDGVYKICHIVMPSSIWLEEVKLNDPQLLDVLGDDLVYYDLDNDKIVGNVCDTATIMYSDAFYFSIEDLTSCFIKINQQVFDGLIGQCANAELKTLEFNRDIVFMAANSIQYSIEAGRYFEAQRTLERVSTCAGICNTLNINTNGCGCSKG